MNKKETGTRGEAKGMPLTIKGRRVSKDYLIEHGIINDYFSPIEKEDDSISRRAAIDAMCNACSDWCDEGVCKEVSAIQRLPSAQPEKVCVAEIKVKGEELQRCIDEAVERIKAEVKSEIIRCEDCKHRPTLDEDGELNFPTYRCPCQCEDCYYSWMPKDDWFCANAERRTDEANR